tara:strand:- start:130 stop:753 length:624 start_codon:yes stop_codon:yes gene_type:complete
MLVRIDDYPTGIKPVIPNRFVEFDKVLSEFESRGLYYLLGVVPYLINEEDIDYLKTLDHAVIALHGYDHNYYTFTELNREEFKGWNTQSIIAKLKYGLETALKDFNINAYIPPFNNFSQNLIDALIELNFDTITTGVNPPNFDYKTLNVMTPKHAFYGTSTEIINNINISTFNKTKDHIALHLTWEIRERSEQKEWQLPSLLDIIND